jgi:pimeloyl-ACP methyl ester carboxylesterase
MSAIVLDEGLIHYEALGRGAHSLVFLHGWLGSWRYWMPAMEEVSIRRRAYAFDLWGYGDSDKLDMCYDISSYVNLLGKFMGEMGIRRVSLVGHALGGLVALHFAIRYPELVNRVMGVSVPVTGNSIARSLSGFSGNGDSLARLISRRASYPEVEMEAQKADVQAIVASARSAIEQDLSQAVFPFDLPILLLHGLNDPLIQPPQSDWQRYLPENVRLLFLRNAQHFPMLEERNKFNRLLLDFLTIDDVGSLELKEEWKRRLR